MRLLPRPAQVVGPPTGYDQIGDPFDRQPAVASPDRLTVKERAKRDGLRRVTALGKGHGPHPEAQESASAGVSRGIVGWHGRAGQDEQPGALSIIDRPPYVIPNPRLQLPLVDEARALTVQHQRRIDRSGEPCLRIHVQPYLAACGLSSGLGLAAGLGPLDQDSADRLRGSLELRVHDSWSVCHALIRMADEACGQRLGGSFATSPGGRLRHTLGGVCDTSRETGPYSQIEAGMLACWYLGAMKATLDLDADLYRAIKVEAARTDRSVKDVVDEALRRWIEAQEDAEDLAAAEAAMAAYERDGGRDAQQVFDRLVAEHAAAYDARGR